MSNHVFHIVDPSLESYRVLYDFEKDSTLQKLKEDNIKIYGIKVTDWRCVSMKANINDIICIKNHLTNIYRKVIE
jgi:ribosomal protein S4E